MRKIIIKKIIVSILILGGLSLVSGYTQAMENDNGGSVTRGGKITFYEEDVKTPEQKESSDIKTEKKKSILPATGESSSSVILVIGVLLICIVLLVGFKWHKKKGERV